MSSIAFIFPGQGSQSPGMGLALAQAFPESRHVFEEVDDALDQHLSRIIFEGPDSELTRTENTQPALMAVSIAALHALRSDGISIQDSVSLMAGHSLGEYTALTAAGVFSLADAARLLRLRGKAMQAAVPQGQGAMAAVLGLEADALKAVLDDIQGDEVLDISNDNAPGQIVISGHKPAVERAIEATKAAGARRAVLLDVSAPFHCRLMQPAAERMAGVLSEMEMRVPRVPIVTNTGCVVETDPNALREALVEQVTATVRWRESVAAMRAEGIGRMVELGAGKVLSGLVRRTDREIHCISAGTPEEIEAVASFIRSL